MISLSPSLSLAEEDVIYWDDHREVRQEKGKDLGLYVDTLFKRAREARTYQERWDAYLKIQKEIPEELILKEGDEVIPCAKREESPASLESSRRTAWKEMKTLLLEAPDEFLNTSLGSKPSEEPFRKFWEKEREGTLFDGFLLSWLIAPYLATKTGGLWMEKVGDLYFEQGSFFRAYGSYKAIQDHSMAYNERIGKKLSYVKESLGERLNKVEKTVAIEGLKLSDGTVFRLVMEKRGMHQEQTPYLEIRFSGHPILSHPELGYPERSEGSPKPKVIRKRIYDFELIHLLNSKKYGPLFMRNEDKILLMPQIGKTFLVFDLNGMLLEKKDLTEEQASRYEIKDIHEFLFSKDDFALIPKGTFNMGSPPTEEKRYDAEILHAVKITKDFYLQRTEVTQLQWYFVTGDAPSYFRREQYCKEEWNPELQICPNHPVENVSWDEVQIFIQKLNEMHSDYVYRLPTEAEWEYAARVSGVSEEERRKFLTPDGSLNICESGWAKTKYGFGDSEDRLDQYAWYYKNAYGQTHSVLDSRIKPIGGLLNMHGNVWEWVSDWYDSNNYGLTEDQLKQTVEDPQGSSSGSHHVFRGGSWYDSPRILRSAGRGFNSPGGRGNDGLGFRALRTKK